MSGEVGLQASHRSPNRFGNWDAPAVHRELLRLIAIRSRFRLRRTLQRIRSPRRIVATSLAVAFLLLYLLNGIFILSAREPADPQRLRLWLSGGMVLYAIYHAIRCVWSVAVDELELTEAEKLWLGGAPLRRSTLAVYHVASMAMPTLLKTLLLTIVLAMDVQYVSLLVVGIFSSLMLLEVVRLIVVRLATSLMLHHRGVVRLAVTFIAGAVGLQVIARLIAMTPPGSTTAGYVLGAFQALGATASSPMIQWLALPWIPAAHLAVTPSLQWITLAQLAACLAAPPLAILLLVRIDHVNLRKRHASEQQRLRDGRFEVKRDKTNPSLRPESKTRQLLQDRLVPDQLREAFAIASRQWVTVQRYAGSVLLSFFVPTLLCLSPLMTGQSGQQWFFVIAGVALCTLLLAPPALRIDFRRDLKRMHLLRMLPISPLSIVIGQLAVPVMITAIYQWGTLTFAAWVTGIGIQQWLLWCILMAGLGVITFAGENALFLMYPHHSHSEGIAMMIRAKLTFLAKGIGLCLVIGLLVGWAVLCRHVWSPPLASLAFIGGATLATCVATASSVLAASRCWQRFDFSFDTPPQ